MWLKKIWWLFSDKCLECGGHLSEHINGKFYCDDCGANNG